MSVMTQFCPASPNPAGQALPTYPVRNLRSREGGGLARGHRANKIIGVPMPEFGKLLAGMLAALRASSRGQAPWGGVVRPGSSLLPCSWPHYHLSHPVFILFAAEDPRLRPAGLPLFAQPSRPCSTRLWGGDVLGGPCAPSVQKLQWFGPLHIPDPPIPVP